MRKWFIEKVCFIIKKIFFFPIIKKSQISEEKLFKKFICQSPIGTGKSTAIRKCIYSTVPNNKFIVDAPTINIAKEFYSKLYVALNNKYPNDVDDMIKVCMKDGAFKEFKSEITTFIPTVSSIVRGCSLSMSSARP